MKSSQKNRASDAVIMWANYHMFSPGQTLRRNRIQSRNLLWCRGGNGVLRINGTDYPMQPGDFVLTPMDFSVIYQSAEHEPFYVGSIHLLPASSCDRNPPFAIYHAPPDSEESFPAHDPLEIAGTEQTLSGSFRRNPQIEHLADYIVRWFSSPLRSQNRALTLAHLLTDELTGFSAQLVNPLHTPPLLLQIQNYIETRLDQRITLTELANKAGCSPATVVRLFRENTETPPMHWVSRRRMERAAELLRTTTLRAGEIGARVGIEDPYHFSKLFRKFHGTSALKYRQEHGAL